MKTEKGTLKSMSQKLRELRLQKGLSMREAAKRIGVPETTYREWEYGRAIRGEPYMRIVKVFGISLQELLGEASRLDRSLEDDLERIISDLVRLKTQILTLKK